MKMELFCWKTRWKSDWRNSQNEKLLTKQSEQGRLVGTAEQTFSNGISGSWSWNGPYFYNFKDSKDASKFWVGFSRMPSHVISIAMGVLCRSQWELYFQGASKNHRLITTCWNRPQEVSGPKFLLRSASAMRSNEVASGFILMGTGSLQGHRLYTPWASFCSAWQFLRCTTMLWQN